VADPIFDELNLTTQKEIYPRVIEDNFFLDTPLLAYLRDHCRLPFGGGAFMQATFGYAPMLGGFYSRGGNFNITKVQTLAGCIFDPKYIQVSVPEYKEDVQVLNKGPLAVFSLIDTDLRFAMQTMNAQIAVAMARHGQAAGGAVVDNRPEVINGWAEAINDGITNSWDGNVFATYGTATRNAVVGSALNSIPKWCGDGLGNAGMITYNVMEEAYQDACVGRQEPDLIVSNKAAHAYMKERLQVQQRFQQERDVIWGVTGFRFNNAMVLKDDYFPSLRYGQNDPIIGNWLTAAFTAAAAPAATSDLPAGIAVNPTEVVTMYNTKKILLRVSNDPEYGFGFTGFKPAQDNTRVVGQILAGLNLEFTSCKLHKQLYGIGS